MGSMIFFTFVALVVGLDVWIIWTSICDKGGNGDLTKRRGWLG